MIIHGNRSPFRGLLRIIRLDVCAHVIKFHDYLCEVSTNLAEIHRDYLVRRTNVKNLFFTQSDRYSKRFSANNVCMRIFLTERELEIVKIAENASSSVLFHMLRLYNVVLNKIFELTWYTGQRCTV